MSGNRYTAAQHEVLYTQDDHQDAERGTSSREWGKQHGHQSVKRYRTKRIVSGDYLELESYPVWEWQRDAGRAKKARPSEAAQRAQNQKNARKKLVRLMNTNFTEEDLFLTLTYKGGQPATAEEARKDMQDYIRRIRSWRKKRDLPELRYIYTIEYEMDGRKQKVHHHIVMSGMDRDEAERLWGLGRANTHRLQPDDYGFEGLARYITKTQGQRQQGERLWCCSRNLQQPKVTFSDRKITKGAVERGAVDEEALRALIQRREPGYVVNDISIKTSEFVPGAYVSVRLRRSQPRGSPPKRRRGRPPDGVSP